MCFLIRFGHEQKSRNADKSKGDKDCGKVEKVACRATNKKPGTD
jgi:hypothetical protein